MQSYEMDGLVLHSKLDYNHDTSFCSYTSLDNDDDVGVPTNDQNINQTIDISFTSNENNDDDNDDNDGNDDDSFQNIIKKDTSSTSLPPIHSILFAPRKDRNKQRTMIYDQSVNPVDHRLEQLIRHSRIQAMVQSSQSQTDNSSKHKKLSIGDETTTSSTTTSTTNRKKDGRNSIWNLQRRRSYENMLSLLILSLLYE